MHENDIREGEKGKVAVEEVRVNRKPERERRQAVNSLLVLPLPQRATKNTDNTVRREIKC